MKEIKDKKESVPFTTGGSAIIVTKPIPAILSKRWHLAIVGFFVFVNLYALRVNMSVAIVCMVNQTAVKLERAALDTSPANTTVIIDSCPGRKVGNSSTTSSMGEFNWDLKTQGLVLSSFFWGYVITQIPAGWLAQKYGGKRVLGSFMFAAVASSLLSSVGARTSPYMLIALRIINGLGQGAMFPVMHALWSKWAPPLERSKLIGFTYAGSQIGNVIALPVSGLLCDYGFDGGWSSIFYVFGGLGVVTLAAWMYVVSDSPAKHPSITEEERNFIETSIGSRQTKVPPTPWLLFFKSVPFWAIIVAQFCVLWGTFTLLTNIPTYMTKILKFNIKSNGALSMIPYILFWLCINFGGFASDHLRAKGYQTKNVRKLMLSLGAVIPAIFLILTGYVPCDNPFLAVAFISVALGTSGFHFPGVMVNHADIAPPFAAVMFGIANSIGTVSGIFAPYVVSVLTPNETQEEWRSVFYLSAAIYFFGAIVFCIWGDGEVQDWVKPYMQAAAIQKTPLKTIYSPDGANKKDLEANGGGKLLDEDA